MWVSLFHDKSSLQIIAWDLDVERSQLVVVLIHLDQHFIERESYRSGRERTLEIQGRGWYATCVICPLCCVMTNKAPGPWNQLSLPPSGSRTRARVERESATFLNWSPDLEREGLSARDCLRDSQAICYFQESLRTIIINKDKKLSAKDGRSQQVIDSAKAETVRRHFYIWVSFGWCIYVISVCILISAYFVNQLFM